MEDRAANQTTSYSIRIEIDSEINCVSLNDRHIAICHIVVTAIAHMDPERLERIGGN